MTKRLTTQEIVREDCKREGINFEYFYAGLHAKATTGSILAKVARGRIALEKVS